MDTDTVISNVYHYELSNKMQLPNNNRTIIIEKYQIELKGDGNEFDGFQILIDGLNEPEAKIRE